MTTTNVAGNAAPVCTQQAVVATVGVARDFTCTDPDGDALSYVVEQAPARGVATGGGVLRYLADEPGPRQRPVPRVGRPRQLGPRYEHDLQRRRAARAVAEAPRQPAANAKPKVPCAGLSGKRLAKCKLDRKVAKSCGKLKGKKKTICGKRIRALEKCKKINQGTRQGVVRHRKCVRAAKAIGKPVKKRR